MKACHLFWRKTCFSLVIASMLVVMVSVLSAQAMTLPIRGAVKDSTETFTGTATVHLNGEGDVKLATSKGVSCMGNFSFETWSKGRGKVQCEDGRLGSFAFVTAGFSGSGAGKIADEFFDFIIGK